MKIEFIQSKDLILTTHAGLTTVGTLIQHTDLMKKLNHTTLKEFEYPYHSHADVMKSYLGLLCQGKNDFEPIEPFRKDGVFRVCMQVKRVPSSATLRQRLDAAAASDTAGWKPILLEESAALLKKSMRP